MSNFVLANQATAARRRVYFHLVDANDGLTAETGEAGGQPQISTNGAAWTNTGIGVLSAIGNGRYYADLTQAAVATAGDTIETRYKSSATAECPGDTVRVIAVDLDDATDLGLANLDVAVSTRAAAGATLSGSSPVLDGGDIEVVQGDDYFATQSRSLSWSSTGWPSLSSTGTVTLALTAKGLNGGTWTATPTAVTVGSSSQTVRVELASSDTSLFNLGDPAYSFDISATTTDGHKATLVRASVTVLEQYTT